MYKEYKEIEDVEINEEDTIEEDILLKAVSQEFSQSKFNAEDFLKKKYGPIIT